MEDLEFNGESLVDSWQPEGDTSRPDLLASVIGSVFADGLSRVNIEKMYKFEGRPSQWILADLEKEEDLEHLLLQGKRALKKPDLAQEEVNELSVEFFISGLSYRHTLVQKLAMVGLFLHMAFATLHTVWTAGRGKLSGCWDSITEVVVLAQNSKPAYRALQNTAAGVERSYTFAKKVSIRPTKLPNSGEADHVELLFEEEEAHAENEIIDLQQPDLVVSEPANSSVIPIEDILSNPANISHSLTWPTDRLYSNGPPT